MAEQKDMYQCQLHNCGYIYDPDMGDPKHKIPPGTAFMDLPESWKCPLCGAATRFFRPLAGPGSVMEDGI